MAVLDEANRAALWQEFMSRGTQPLTITKQEIRAAVDALDDYLDANAAAMNSAIPLPARTALTTAQKAFLLQLVVERRWGGSV